MYFQQELYNLFNNVSETVDFSKAGIICWVNSRVGRQRNEVDLWRIATEPHSEDIEVGQEPTDRWNSQQTTQESKDQHFSSLPFTCCQPSHWTHSWPFPQIQTGQQTFTHQKNQSNWKQKHCHQKTTQEVGFVLAIWDWNCYFMIITNLW